MRALTYQLHLEEPLLVAQAQAGEENSAIGTKYVPGSTLRGALVSRYLRVHGVEDLAVDPECRRLFLDGTVCYLNAYPYHKERLLPRPLSWFTEKDQVRAENGRIYDMAVVPETPLQQAKPPGNSDFCMLSGPDRPVSAIDQDEEDELDEPPTIVLDAPNRQINVHISLREPNVRTDENDVYRYDALASGQDLAGVIVGPEVDLNTLKTLLEREDILYLGAAHYAGYGRVTIKNVRWVNDWEEYPSGPPFGSRVVVTLLSDAILRGPDGQTNADLDGALSRLLELPDLKAQTSFLQIKTVSGFNRKWGLPLPQTWALAAGSVAVYRADDIDAQQLRAAVRDGIGERRAEGFGRLAVNWHTWPDLPFGKPITKADPRPRLKASSRALAQKMARRRLERVLEQGLVSRVSQAELGACPSNAQLSRVRNAAQQAFHSRSLEALSAHLAALRGAKEQLANAKVNGVPMFNWLEERISEMDIEAQLLGGQSLPRIAGVEAEIDTEMRVFYTSRLIDAVMQKAIRLNQREAA